MKKTLNLSVYFLLVSLMAAPLMGTALAEKGSMNVEEAKTQVQTLQQAAAELKATDPALSEKLQKMAQKKQDWMDKKMKEGNDEKKEK